MDVVVELGAVSPGTKAASREATAVRSTMAGNLVHHRWRDNLCFEDMSRDK